MEMEANVESLALVQGRDSCGFDQGGGGGRMEPRGEAEWRTEMLERLLLNGLPVGGGERKLDL